MNLPEKEQQILDQIRELAEQSWFHEGLDCPDPKLIENLENAEVEIKSLQDLIDLTVSGPDSTDVFLPTKELIGDILEEDQLTEDEIFEANRMEFSELRIFTLNGFEN
jgi:hypothetical protein